MIIDKKSLPVGLRQSGRRLIKTAKRIGKKVLRTPEILHELKTETLAKRHWMSDHEIAEYRKKIKIYDVFTFFNELDLFELRLNILDPYVDYFVLVEATQTFSGQTKPLYYKENKERYSKWNHKIIHLVVDDVPSDAMDLRNRLKNNDLDTLDRDIIEEALKSDNIGKDTHWLKEFYIKESIKRALKCLGDDDICYVSDVDEIWNPDLVIDFSKDDVFKPVQTPYVYYLNNRSDENWHGWTGTIVTKYANIKKSCLNHLRTHRKMMDKYVFLRNGGWHFTFQGGAVGAKRKIVESNNPAYYSDTVVSGVEDRVLRNEDHRGRNIKFWIDESGLPKYLLDNKAKYASYFKKPQIRVGKLKRSDLINSIIKKFGYKTYLEIGVNTPAQPGYNWSHVKIETKHGVDPNPSVKATYPVPSDEFFNKYVNMKYDLVFVDGLHIFEQAYRDIKNSLKWLADNGTIVVHDCNPLSEITQRRIRASHAWHGDVWKAILKLRMEEPNLSIWTVNTDEGCAIIRRGSQRLFVPNDKTNDIFDYEYFDANRRQILNLIEVSEFKKLLKSGL